MRLLIAIEESSSLLKILHMLVLCIPESHISRINEYLKHSERKKRSATSLTILTDIEFELGEDSVSVF